MPKSRFVFSPTTAESGIPIEYKLSGVQDKDVVRLNTIRFSCTGHQVLNFADHVAGLGVDVVVSLTNTEFSVDDLTVLSEFTFSPDTVVVDTVAGTVDAYYKGMDIYKEPFSGPVSVFGGVVYITPFIDDAVTSGLAMSILFDYSLGGSELEAVQALFG